MIIFVRTASVMPGKMGEAMAAAREIAAYVSKKFGVTLEVMLPVGGNPNRIAWRSEYSGLGDLEETFNQTITDADYGALVAKIANLFIAGSVEDVIWRKV